MLTITMTADEMGQHIETDLIKLVKWLGYQHEAFLKLVKKRPPRMPFYSVIEKTVKSSHQKYYFIFTHISFDGKNFDVLWTCVAELRDYLRTYYVYRKSAFDKQIRMLSSHLIARYAERMGIPYTPRCLFEFINNNFHECCIYKDNPDSPTKMVSAVADGLILSQVTGNHLCIGRTFISKDMLKTTQKETYDRIYDTVVEGSSRIAELMRQGWDKNYIFYQISKENKRLFESCQKIYAKYFENK